MRLIETNDFDFEFLSQLAERESWRKEIHRPIYHLHKWWAKRLGSVFRGILLGSALEQDNSLKEAFYNYHDFQNINVFDPFMGSGTTIGEGHKLGFSVLGRDINPIAVESSRIAFGEMNKEAIDIEFKKLSKTVGEKILELYRSTDSAGFPCDVLYFFWAMQASCPACANGNDLFSSWVIARNAYPNRKSEIQVLCPACGDIFPSTNGLMKVSCRSCKHEFNPNEGNVQGSKVQCKYCSQNFPVLSAMKKTERPEYRPYGKLILTREKKKEYLKITGEDLRGFKKSSNKLRSEVQNGSIKLPDLALEDGYNTKQALSYGFKSWKDFFNDRQLLALSWLNNSISEIKDPQVRDLFLVVFSGVLEFNNMFASYKGEGTGAVRHMFSHHILKPERTPIEANIWGTTKSSGSFSNLFRNKVDRAISYRLNPTEVKIEMGTSGVVCSKPFSGRVELDWPTNIPINQNGIYLSCGDSASTGMPSESIDLVVTDPPFFDNVHYSELADFFFAWQSLSPRGFIKKQKTTRSLGEVQDSDPVSFERKLQAVFRECHRLLKPDGLLVFSYHHSRDEGWHSVANAILNAGFTVVNSHPVKSEMSVATPKSQANEPIQLDVIIVCRKDSIGKPAEVSPENALETAAQKIIRLEAAGFSLSINDKKVIRFGQLLTSLHSNRDVGSLHTFVERERTGALTLF